MLGKCWVTVIAVNYHPLGVVITSQMTLFHSESNNVLCYYNSNTMAKADLNSRETTCCSSLKLPHLNIIHLGISDVDCWASLPHSRGDSFSFHCVKFG